MALDERVMIPALFTPPCVSGWFTDFYYSS